MCRLIMRNLISLDGFFRGREEVEAFLKTIDADDDVQNIYVGLAG